MVRGDEYQASVPDVIRDAKKPGRDERRAGSCLRGL
jgi:hypothetical protein